MQNSTFRSIVALALLAAGTVFVYLFGPSELAFGSAVANRSGFSYVADLDYWQRTDRERIIRTTSAFDLAHDLSAVPLTIGDWTGEDYAQANPGVFEILEPEQYVERLYQNNAGQYLWLTMIGGRSSRTFHPPEMCYDSYGWQTQLSSRAIPLEEGGEVYGLMVEARKRVEEGETPTEQVSFFVYLFPDRARDPSNGIVIFRLTTARYGTVDETMAIQGEFLRHLFKGARATGAF